MSSPFDDTFTGADGSSPNPIIWTVVGTPTIQSNTLEIVNDDEYVVCKLTFTGDFNIQVDFATQSEPATNYWTADLLAYIDGTHYVGGRASYNSGKKFQSFYINGGSLAYDTATRTNTYGKLKLTRTGNSFSIYDADGAGGFSLLGTHTIGSAGNQVSIWIRCQHWGASPNITCRFDNFLINSGYTSRTNNCVSLSTCDVATEGEETPSGKDRFFLVF
ncbi:MAG: hypothetical protein WC637_00575 [Victivallales bacterium]|jgi:hypothetical protein